MTLERILSFVSLGAVAIAATASAVQAYVSWSGRNDIRQAAALSQVIRACGDFNAEWIHFVSSKTMKELVDYTAAYNVVAMSIYPLRHQGYERLAKQHQEFILIVDPQLEDKALSAAIDRAAPRLNRAVEEECTRTIEESTGK